jgi:hypothetical protein
MSELAAGWMVALSDDADPQEQGRSDEVGVPRLSLCMFISQNEDGLADRHFGAVVLGLFFLSVMVCFVGVCFVRFVFFLFLLGLFGYGLI